VKQGAPVPLVFRVGNAGGSEVTLQLEGRDPTADFVVTGAGDRVVWSRLKGQIVLGSLRLYPLAPGKALTFRHTWNQRNDSGKPVPPGEYLVRGVLLTDQPGGMPSPAVRIRIER
jgi:hypothetical protein